MCEPTIMLGLMAASTGLSMFNQVQQGKAQQQIMKSKAQAAKTSNALREDQRARDAATMIARQRARAGVSGAQVADFATAYQDTTAKQGEANYLDRAQTALDVGGYNFAGQQAVRDGYVGALTTGLNFGVDAIGYGIKPKGTSVGGSGG